MSSIYQGLRGKTTQKWEQKHKAATGEEALTFSGQEKDLVAFFAYELPLTDSPARDERADMESMLAGAFICSCKTKN